VKNAAPSISPSRALARRRSHDDRSASVRDRGDPRPAPGPPGACVDRRGGDDRCAAGRRAPRCADGGVRATGFARRGPASV